MAINKTALKREIEAQTNLREMKSKRKNRQDMTCLLDLYTRKFVFLFLLFFFPELFSHIYMRNSTTTIGYQRCCNYAMPHTLARRPKWKLLFFFYFFKSRVCPCQRPPYEMEDPAREFFLFFLRIWEFIFIYIFRSSQTNYCNSGSFSFCRWKKKIMSKERSFRPCRNDKRSDEELLWTWTSRETPARARRESR
jgi:hypothetical protein